MSSTKQETQLQSQEFKTSSDIRDIIFKEIRSIKKKQETEELEGKDFMALEKLAKIHAILGAEMREMKKSGFFGELSDEELDALEI